jgi:hypothetical protein
MGIRTETRVLLSIVSIFVTVETQQQTDIE